MQAAAQGSWFRQRVPLFTECRVFVFFRARSMTEQQEHSEDSGLVSTQDLDPSKDDDSHGHFRQVSQTPSKTCVRLIFPHAPSVSCARSWVTAPGRLLGFMILFEIYLKSNNGQTHFNHVAIQNSSKLMLAGDNKTIMCYVKVNMLPPSFTAYLFSLYHHHFRIGVYTTVYHKLYSAMKVSETVGQFRLC